MFLYINTRFDRFIYIISGFLGEQRGNIQTSVEVLKVVEISQAMKDTI